MPWIAFVAAAAAKAIGSIQEGNARAAQLNTEGAQHDHNAQIAEQNAVIAWQQGTAHEAAVRRRARGILGQQAAGLAESGMDSGSGSALAIANQSAVNAELDSLTTLYNSDLRARGYKLQAENERYAGNLAHAGAGDARRTAIFGAITGATSSAASYYGGNPSGGGGGGGGSAQAFGGSDFSGPAQGGGI